MFTPPPNPRMAPHFYVSGNKSTNHRTTNQVAPKWPVLNAQKQLIALNISSFYEKSAGSGDIRPELATMVLSDVENHTKITGHARRSHRWPAFVKRIYRLNEPVLFDLIPDELQDQF